MTRLSLLQLLSLLIVLVGQALSQSRVLMCYYTNWSQYRSSNPFFPENIDVNYCTHLIFSFAKVSSDNKLTNVEWNDIVSYNKPQGLYYRFNQLKTKNRNLKTLLAVGGYKHRSGPFTRMSATTASRQTFITSAIKWLRDNNFDGLDIDWEYPADSAQGGQPQDKQNFALLLQEMRKAFNDEGARTGKPVLLMTAAVSAGYSTVRNGYDVAALNRNLDFINLMAYDLHGPWERKTGANAGLYTSSTDSNNLSVSQVAQNWVNLGADKSKLLIGLATYGHTWTLSNPNNHGMGAAASGPGQAGSYSKSKGLLFYPEVCKDLRNKNYVSVFDSQTKTPYAYLGDQWITYENVKSLKYKMTWIVNNGYGGAIVWAIEEDDFDGKGCGQGAYPLLRAINQCIVQGRNCAPSDGGSVPGTTMRPVFTTPSPFPITTRPTQPTFPATTTMYTRATQPTVPTQSPTVWQKKKSDQFSSVNISGVCRYRPGLFPDTVYCAKYWVCTFYGTYQATCLGNTFFNPQNRRCQRQVDCKGRIMWPTYG